MKIAIIIALIILLLCIWGYIEAHNFYVHRYEYKNKKIPPSFSDVKLLYLVDLHNVHYGKFNMRLKNSIAKASPDYVLIGGDFLSKNDDTYDSAIDLITWLCSKYPVYFVNGNHETKMKLYPDDYKGIYKEFFDMAKGVNCNCLSNQKVFIKRDDDKIVLDCLELSLEFYGMHDRKDLRKEDIIRALGKVDKRYFNLMLAHSPRYLDAYSEWGADLVLSGHNHGGLARIPGVCGVISTEARLFPKYTKGFYHKGDTTMLVSAGIGGHTLPVRFFNLPEALIITLKKED